MSDRALVTKQLGRYDIIRVLGKGAMGVVYEARDPNLNRKVAIKTVRVSSLTPEEAAEYELRFRTEAHSAARLQHPNIVSVYDSDRDGDTPFLVMEYVKGDDLKHYLDTGQRYTLEQSVRMVCDLLSALDYAHQRKIIHRDIKPANLLIEADGRVKLTDFGVARIQDSGEATRTQGGLVGTLKYMSPEQVEGKSVDASSDLFSAGIVLYQLLTDRRPFDGDSYFSIVTAINSHEPPAPSSINALLPLALDAVVARALAKDKSLRFATAQDFALALQAAARRADPTITPSANPYKVIEPLTTDGRERSGSSSRTHTGITGGTGGTFSGSAITQELELVYWKDVKDSRDREDLEGFLIRFPEGVYADLAKRRLKRLSDNNAVSDSSFGATVLTSSEKEMAAAKANFLSTIPLQVAAPAPQPVDLHVEPTFSNSVISVEDTYPSIAQAPVVPKDLPKKAQTVKLNKPEPVKATPAASLPSPNPARRSKTGWLVGATAALAMAVAAVWIGTGSKRPSGAEPTLKSAAASMPKASVIPPKPAPTLILTETASMPDPSTTAAILEAIKPAAVNRSATRSETTGLTSTISAKPNKTLTAKLTPKQAATHDTAKPLPAPGGQAHTPAGPREACAGKFLFAYGACLIEQCEHSTYHNHPVCVERREQDAVRKAAEANR
ncbi:MAG: protein kinase [Burkholderiaceae bacterium]